MKELLEKTRQISKVVQTAGGSVDFEHMSQVLRDVIDANIYLVDHQGKLLGHALMRDFECGIIEGEILDRGAFPTDYNEDLLKIVKTTINLKPNYNQCVFDENVECVFPGKVTTIVPIYAGEKRLGTLILARFNTSFNDEDLLLAEYGATVAGMEILRAKSQEIETEARKKAAVQVALGTLSYSEMEAVEHIFAELDGEEGLLVASKIADRVGITRSVIVNALRKFESAGVIETRSLGMKGTYIKVLNEYLIPELANLR
ncbi:MAG: GTP-sensing pleiotropic transcriptional regulator CodY [Firmicutes bacterium]|nr:GTP-sensing pleiotropic transcriptional regulator CodY [Bacillota bacterium]